MGGGGNMVSTQAFLIAFWSWAAHPTHSSPGQQRLHPGLGRVLLLHVMGHSCVLGRLEAWPWSAATLPNECDDARGVRCHERSCPSPASLASPQGPLRWGCPVHGCLVLERCARSSFQPNMHTRRQLRALVFLTYLPSPTL